MRHGWSRLGCGRSSPIPAKPPDPPGVPGFRPGWDDAWRRVTASFPSRSLSRVSASIRPGSRGSFGGAGGRDARRDGIAGGAVYSRYFDYYAADLPDHRLLAAASVRKPGAGGRPSESQKRDRSPEPGTRTEGPGPYARTANLDGTTSR